MNERIRLLAEKARIKDHWSIDEGRYLTNYLDEQKFAQLIVAECAELFVDQKYMVLNPHEPFANERVRALKQHDKDTVKKIRQHFGVLE